MERKPLVKERVWLLIGQLMCQVEEQAQHIEELEAQLARVLPVMDAPSAEVGPIGTIRGIVRDNSNSDTTEIPAAT